MDDWSPRTVRRPGPHDVFSSGAPTRTLAVARSTSVDDRDLDTASQPTVGLGLQGGPWLDAQTGRPRCGSDARTEGSVDDSQRVSPLPWASSARPAPPLARSGSLGLPRLVTNSMWPSPASESDLPLHSPSAPLSRQASSSSRHTPGCSPLAKRATLAVDNHPGGLFRRSSSPSPYSSRSATPLIPFEETDGLESGASSRTGSTTSSSDVPSTKTFDPLELGLRALRSLGGDRDATPRSTGTLPLASAMRLFATGSVLSRRTKRTQEPGSGTASPARTPNMRSLALPLTGSPILRSRRSAQTLGPVPDSTRKRSRSIQNRFREQERSKVLRKRVDVLTAVATVAVLGTVVLLVRMLFLPSGTAPLSPRKGATVGLHPQRDTLALYRIIGNDLPPRHSPGQTLTNLRFLLEHEDDFDALPSLSGLASASVTKRHSSKKASRSLFGSGGRDRLKVEKFYVLNRLANATQIASVRGLLEEHAVDEDHILEIPFEWDEYKKRSWTWDREVGWGEGMEAVWGIGRKTADNATRELPREVSVAALAGTGSTEQDVTSSEDSWLARKEAMARLRALDYTYHDKNLYAMNNVGRPCIV